MLITMTATKVTPTGKGFFVGNPGETKDVDDEFGQSLIDEGVAELAAPADPVVTADTDTETDGKRKGGRPKKNAPVQAEDAGAPVAPPAGEEAPIA